MQSGSGPGVGVAVGVAVAVPPGVAVGVVLLCCCCRCWVRSCRGCHRRSRTASAANGSNRYRPAALDTTAVNGSIVVDEQAPRPIWICAIKAGKDVSVRRSGRRQRKAGRVRVAQSIDSALRGFVQSVTIGPSSGTKGAAASSKVMVTPL